MEDTLNKLYNSLSEWARPIKHWLRKDIRRMLVVTAVWVPFYLGIGVSSLYFLSEAAALFLISGLNLILLFVVFVFMTINEDL